MEIKEFHKKNINKLPPEEMDSLIKKQRKEHDKLCKGMFEFIDAQGGYLEFTYRWFRGDPLITIKLTHGEICELPMGIVKHLNNTKKKIRRISPNISETGRGVPSTFETISRVRFTPMEVL